MIFLATDQSSVKLLLRHTSFNFLPFYFNRSQRQNAQQPAYKMLFSVAGLFLVSNICAVSVVLTSFVLAYPTQTKGIMFARNVIELIYPLPALANSCGNFFVLFITMKSFRDGLKKVFRVGSQQK